MPMSPVMRFFMLSRAKSSSKATPDEKARMLELLVASVTLYEDKMDIEVRTEGLICAM